MQKKFYLNEGTGTLHIIGGCPHAKTVPSNAKTYETIDEVIAENTRYVRHCKRCFKENKM